MTARFMDEVSIKEQLRAEGLNPLTVKDISQLMISEKVIRCESADDMIVGMGSNRTKDDQIKLIIDGLHLCLEKGKNSFRIVLGRQKDDRKQREVENAVALLIKSIKMDGFRAKVEVDGESIDLNPQSFNAPKIERWMKCLNRQENIPELARELEEAICDRNFKWYKNITGGYWSGRVGGLEVCRLKNNNFQLDIGKTGKNGKNGKVRKEFLNICQHENIDPGFFSQSQFNKVASVIRVIAESRRSGVLNESEREHLLESQILCGDLEIVSKSGVLKPICGEHPFQFPVLWEPSAEPRFIDALMKAGDIPYVVELKEGHSPGQYYRHGITQAVLYREFIKMAEKVHPWFAERGLVPDKCRAAVAFPELAKENKKHQRLLEQHKKVAKCFDVEIIELRINKHT